MANGEATSILETIDHLAVHEHLALLYSSQREQFDVIAPFLRAGLERGEQCLYLVDDITPTGILTKLGAEGIEAVSAVEAKSLVIEPRKRGYFDPEFALRFLKEEAESAIADGFAALRIASDMSWILAREGGIERLGEFEALLNYFFPQYPALGICQYNLQRFHPETVKEIVLSHPSVFVGGSLRKNPMEDSNVRLNLVITEHQRTEERLRQSEMRLSEAQRLAHIGSYDFDVHSGVTQWSDETFRILGLDPTVSKPSIDELVRTVHPDDKIRVERAIVSAYRERVPFELEFKIVVGHSVKSILGLGQVALNDAGEVMRMYGTIMDITERRRILDALQSSEERYRRLLSSVTDYVYSVAITEGRATSTSHGAGCLAVTGYTTEDHLSDPFLWYKMVHPDDRALVTEEADRRMRGESTRPLEHRILHKNGTVRWVRNTIVPRHDAAGVLTGYDGLVEDITERKMMEEDVRRSEQYFRTIIDESDRMVMMCTQDHRIEFMNSQFLRRAGRDARGEDCREFVRLLAGACPGFLDERAFAGERVSWEEQCHTDGRWFFIANTPVQGVDGKASVLITIQDITDRKHDEQTLKVHHQRYADLVDTVEDWIWEVDTNGVYTFSNRAVKALLGFDPGEVVGKSIDDFLMPFEGERVVGLFRSCVATQQSITGLENVCRHKDGHPVVVETSARPFFDKDGTLAGYRGIDRDVTERKQLQQAGGPIN